MRALLVNALPDWNESFPCEPIDLAYLTAYLRANGHEATYIKQLRGGRYHTAQDVLAEAEKYQPDLVGFSTVYTNQKSSTRLARLIKERLGVPIVFGGYYPSGHLEMCREPHADYVVVGEGEGTLLELMGHLSSGFPALEGIAGLAYARDAKLVLNPPRARINDLDALPFPTRMEDLGYRQTGLFGDSFPLVVVPPHGFILVSSRGCPFACDFCMSSRMYQGRRLVRSVENVLAEIQDLRSRYDVRGLYFMDPDFFAGRDRTLRLLDALADIGIPWGAEAAVASLDHERIVAAARGGCRHLTVGYETGDEAKVTTAGKPYDQRAALRAARLLKQNEIETHGTFIIGFPEDDASGCWNTIRFAASLDPEMMFLGFLKPYRGTRSYDQAVGCGWLSDETEFRRMTRIYLPVVPTRHLGRTALLLLLLAGYLYFYLRPSRLRGLVNLLCNFLGDMMRVLFRGRD